jgi:hypothetical protein
MMGIIADFPVLDAPEMTLTLPISNETTRGASRESRGHKTTDLI